MRIRRLTPRSRTRLLACGLFLIGLSTTASLLSPVEQSGVQPVSKTPAATLAAEATQVTGRTKACPTAG